MKTLQTVANYIKKEFKMNVECDGETITCDINNLRRTPFGLTDKGGWDLVVLELEETLNRDEDVKSHVFTTPYVAGLIEMEKDFMYFQLSVEFYGKPARVY